MSGLLYGLLVLALLAAVVFVGGAYVLEQVVQVKEADAAIQVQETIQQRDYYAYLATIALMSQQAAHDMPDWFMPALLLALGGDVLLGWLYFTRKGAANER